MPEITAGVLLGDRRVGTLGYADGNTWFRYEDRDLAHPVLGQCFELDPARRRNASGRLPEWFSNLLPEPGSGLRTLIAGELGRRSPHDFQLILFLGRDLPGAVRVVVDDDAADIPELSAAAAAPEPRRQVRFSLAGVQPKFSMRWEGKGLVLPMSGLGGDWIVKLPDRRFREVTANEFAMLTWARLAGIDIPEIRLLRGDQLSGLPSGLIKADELALGVRRFDREGAERIHQEDFAQIREVSSDSKYDNATYSGIGRVLQAICAEDIDEYVRRLAMIVVAGNTDAHLKNWTVRYPGGRKARLSPAYDLVSISAYEEFASNDLAFALNGGRRPEAVTMANFRRMAEKAGFSEERACEVASATVAALIGSWPEVTAGCPVPRFLARHIEQRLRELPLAQEARA